MAKWFRVPNSRFDRLPDLDAALEALRESKIYQQVRKRHRFDEDGDFEYGFLEAKGNLYPKKLANGQLSICHSDRRNPVMNLTEATCEYCAKKFEYETKPNLVKPPRTHCSRDCARKTKATTFRLTRTKSKITPPLGDKIDMSRIGRK